ncbi:hypothetical protein KTE91_31285 [Burkholderia multivorans]|uniref:hypothetical protein n=1 Tax=Burkholderia multivorans TaxID=87883 RepID=UPI001C247B30|nr:hypothetical protein [Burkholderia multivorans]MBU9439562.1 hypothetical protein [Burkholderia multivorans]
MRHQSLTFMQASELIVEHPCAIRTARIVCVADGFQLRARFPGQRGEWTLTSPGGIADTFPSLPGLEAFARVVLADKPLSIDLA